MRTIILTLLLVFLGITAVKAYDNQPSYSTNCTYYCIGGYCYQNCQTYNLEAQRQRQTEQNALQFQLSYCGKQRDPLACYYSMGRNK